MLDIILPEDAGRMIQLVSRISRGASSSSVNDAQSMPAEESGFLVSARPIIRYRDLTGLMQADRPRCCRRQVDVPAAHERAAIVDPHDHASAMANTNTRSERQGAMSCGHCRTIKAFSVGGATATQAIAAAIDACHFSTRQLDAAKQRKRGPNKKLQIAREQSAHYATSPFEPSTEGFRRHPQTVPIPTNCYRINGKISADAERTVNECGKPVCCVCGATKITDVRRIADRPAFKSVRFLTKDCSAPALLTGVRSRLSRYNSARLSAEEVLRR